MGSLLIIRNADFSANSIGSVAVNFVSAPSIVIDAEGIVTITSDYVVHYTTDGSIPTTDSNIYNAPFSVGKGVTVKAIAVDDGEVSTVSSATSPKGGWLLGLTEEQIVNAATISITPKKWNLLTDSPNSVIKAVKVYVGENAIGATLKISNTDDSNLNTFVTDKAGVNVFELSNPVTINNDGAFAITVNNGDLCKLGSQGLTVQEAPLYKVPMDVYID